MGLDLPLVFATAVGRGVRPAAASLSFASPKESKQRKGDPTVCVPPLRYGQPALLTKRGQAANSLRSNKRPADPRFAPLLGAHRGALTPTRRGASLLGSARLRHRYGALAMTGVLNLTMPVPVPLLKFARVEERLRRAQLERKRELGPGLGLPDPPSAAKARVPRTQPFCVRRGAQGQADQGRALFERSEFARTPLGLSTAGCPQRSEGTLTVGSPFFCLLFFGEAKKSEAAAGRIPRPAASKQTATSNTPLVGTAVQTSQPAVSRQTAISNTPPVDTSVKISRPA